MSKTYVKDANTLITYLNTFQGWSIKNYDNFIVTWQEDDDFQNWCDEDSRGRERRCARNTPYAMEVLKILGWDKETVIFGKG